MSPSREDMISGLCEEAAPRKRVGFARALGEIAGCNLASLILVGAAYGLRHDIGARLHEPLFVIEITLHAALILTATVAAAALAFPDRAYGRYIAGMLYGVSALYITFSLFAASAFYPVAEDVTHRHAHGIACAGCLLSFAALPALFGVWRIARLATVRPVLAGTAALTAAAATGSLGVRLVESEILPHGLFTWHIMPFLLLLLAGAMTGKKIFRRV